MTKTVQELSAQVSQFIEENIELIDRDDLNSWREVYKKLSKTNYAKEFTDAMIEAGVFPRKSKKAELFEKYVEYFLIIPQIVATSEEEREVKKVIEQSKIEENFDENWARVFGKDDSVGLSESDAEKILEEIFKLGK